ncbi:YcbK family protein [Hoeflea sp.]|uniref:YcbK family protein n=1 Tax=Hoeflea sp. TaxID=1940281 RepID=UPI003B017AB0
MRKTVYSVLIVAMAGLPLSGCANFFGIGSYSSKVNYHDTKWCVPRKLKRVLNRVSHRYGTVTVHSTKRWWLENWRKGGARDSYHLRCQAVDFSVRGNPESVLAFLRAQREVGGYSYYKRTGHYHIDTGPRRTW